MTYETQTVQSQLLKIATVKADAHWSWLALGWQDFWATWRYGLVIGAVPVIAAWIMVYVLWRHEMLAFLPAVCGGFALVGPILAVGCYELSRRREAGEPISWRAIFLPRLAAPGQVTFITFALLFLLLVWGRLATLLYAVASNGVRMTSMADFFAFTLQSPAGLIMIGMGSLIGGFIAALAYAISVVAIPLVANRQVDAMTAMITSVRVVLANKGAMVSYAFNIAVLIAISFATGFLALIIIFPWLGHATWRAYRDTIHI